MESSQNQYSGVFKVSIGVQTYAEASTGDIFLKKFSFFSQNTTDVRAIPSSLDICRGRF